MKTLEEYLPKLSDSEKNDLRFCLRHFGGGSVGVVADEHNMRFFTKAYAEACIERALDSDNLTDDGKWFIRKLRRKLLWS